MNLEFHREKDPSTREKGEENSVPQSPSTTMIFFFFLFMGNSEKKTIVENLREKINWIERNIFMKLFAQ